MADIRDIKLRSEGIKKILKVTAAMQIVAATKLKRAEQAALDSRDYLKAAEELLGGLSIDGDKGLERLFAPAPGQAKACLVAVCSDRGLCGSFNSSLFKKVEDLGLRPDSSVIPLGKKGLTYFQKRGLHLVTACLSDKGDSLRLSRNIAGYILEKFRAGQIDKVYLAYNRFKPHALPKVVLEPLLPVENRSDGEKKDSLSSSRALYLYEPAGEELVYLAVGEYLFARVRTALLESAASEEMSRMLTMKYATDNGNELLGDLMLQYHKLRQANITREILEVVGG